MQRITMPVSLPAYQDMLNGIETIATGYKGVNKNRLELIELMKRLRTFLNDNRDDMGDERRLAILIGAYVFVLERVKIEKWQLQGSSLRDLINKVLGKTFLTALDDKAYFIYLNEFKTFVVSNTEAESRIVGLPLKERYNEIQSIMLGRMKSDIKQLSDALPKEQVIDERLQRLVEQYKHKKALPYEQLNKDRLFMAQLAQVVAALQPRRDKEYADMFSPTCRVKMGILFYILQTVNSSRSELYKLCVAILNGNDLSNIHTDIQKISLLALRNYLRESVAAGAVESKGRAIFNAENQLQNLEVLFNDFIKSINVSVDADAGYGFSTLTMMLATAGAIVCAVPGIGAGQAGGNSLAKTDYMLRPMSDVAIPLRPSITYFIGGPAGKLIGYYSANQVVSYTLESGLGLACGTLSGMLGLTTGLLVGITLFELTPAALKAICRACLATHQQIDDPNLADKFDMRIINILLEMPDDQFTQDQKQHLRNNVLGRVADTGFYAARPLLPHPPAVPRERRALPASSSTAQAAAATPALLAPK